MARVTAIVDDELVVDVSDVYRWALRQSRCLSAPRTTFARGRGQ